MPVRSRSRGVGSSVARQRRSERDVQMANGVEGIHDVNRVWIRTGDHAMTIPGFTAEASLYRASRRYRTSLATGRATGVLAAHTHPDAIGPAGVTGRSLPARSSHFCPGVCWCCETYHDWECCYACAVCHIAESA